VNKIIRVCHGKWCKEDAKDIMQCGEKRLRKGNISEIKIEASQCMGECKKNPNIMLVSKEKREIKHNITPKKIEREIDIFSRSVPKTGEARKTVNDLLSGGF
jgi:NADH:ubiquinone oxidoreductase subunit E